MVAPTGVDEESPGEPVNPETAQAATRRRAAGGGDRGSRGEPGSGTDGDGATRRSASKGRPCRSGTDGSRAGGGRGGASGAELGRGGREAEGRRGTADAERARRAEPAEARESRDVSPLAVAAIIFVVIALVGVAAGVLAVATHGFHKKTVVTYRPAAVFKLRPGDCINSAPNGLTVTVLSCGTPHDAEVFATFALPKSSWPGNTAVEQAAGNGCASRLGAYLNPDLANAGLAQEFVYPNQTAWQAGERTVVCEVSSSTGKLTGSVREAELTAARPEPSQPLPADHHRAQPEVIVADDQVSFQARPQGSDPVAEAEHASRGRARRGGHLGNRQARGHRLPDDAVHGGGGTGDRARATRYRRPGVPLPRPRHPHGAEPVAAIGHPGRRHGVGDQDEPARAGGAGHQADGHVVQVHAIGDRSRR